MQTDTSGKLIALIAGVVLIVAVGLTAARDDGAGGVTVDDLTADGDATATDGEAAAEGATGEDGATEGGDAAGDGTTEDGAAEDAGTETGGTAAPVGSLTAPQAGTYAYASTGSYELSGDGETTLPAEATGTVTVQDANWSIQVDAGDAYTDRFGFELGEAGVQWTTWSLDRVLLGSRGTTNYTCTGDEPYYTADPEPGRSVSHGCTTSGVDSAGTVVVQGQEPVTLGDGTEVVADHVVYEYAVSGPSVTGEGRLELWLDRATGLRLREVRHIESTSTLQSGEDVDYREDVEFVLVSLTPTTPAP